MELTRRGIPLNKQYKKILQQFQCDYIREIEEMFAQTLSEKESVRLFFINENDAFTDGTNIVVDPAMRNIYADIDALINTEKHLKLPPYFSSDPWNALWIITRWQTIHESLHILYTDFPCPAANDEKCDTKVKLKTMCIISNIIEDAYIEAVGCSVFDNLELFLKFGRVASIFAKQPSDGTAASVLGKQGAQDKKSYPLVDYLNYMIDFLLYPMLKLAPPPAEIADFVNKTKHLFLEGSAAPFPDERYGYCRKIFDIILPLIPEDDILEALKGFENKLNGMKTHSPGANTIGKTVNKGKSQAVTVRLFTDLEGNLQEDSDFTMQVLALIAEYAKCKSAVISILDYEGYFISLHGNDIGAPVLHKNVKINESKPKINFNLKKAYQNIYNRYRININSYNSRFTQLLKVQIPVIEEKHLFGAGISSKRLGDPKKRYWYRKTHGIDIPDMAVLLLIDGSGSMSGARRNSAMISSIILHEVLKKQGIEHAIVEHRAHGPELEIDINILVDFNARDEEKYNLMQLSAYGDNRDGLALYWAERYINQKVHCENKLIIVLSDGLPAHDADDNYPPVSTKDTANAVKKIINRGTNVVAVALDDAGSFECYDLLKEIYPHLISCNDLRRLTGQLLVLISKHLF